MSVCPSASLCFLHCLKPLASGEKCIAGRFVTRDQTKKSDKIHLLKVKEAMSSVDKSTIEEVSRLLSIKCLTRRPTSFARDWLRWNGILKSMLKNLYQDQPKQWLRLINTVLFVYREVSQGLTGFSPFQLLYRRSVRGPRTILKVLRTKEVTFLRRRLATSSSESYVNIWKIQEELQKSQ